MKKLSLLIGMLSLMINPVIISAQDGPTPNEALNVQNLQVDGQTENTVSLSWDAVANATTYRVEFGTSSVSTQGETYNGTPVEVEGANSAVVENLTPNTEYFFSVVSFSENRAEVSSQYSNEVSTTTSAGSEDSWKIDSATATAAGTVEIVFSEEVTLPEAPELEISIRELNNPSNRLTVVSASADSNDAKKVIINTEAQSPETTYAIELSDKFQNGSNQSLSELNRSETFSGFSSAANSDTELKVDEIRSLFIDNNYLVELDFNSDLAEGFTVDSFKIVESNDPAEFLTVQEVKTNNSDASKILLVTDTQQAVNYTVILSSIEGVGGESLNDDTSLVEFAGKDGSTESNPDPVTAVKLSNVQITPAEGKIEVTWNSDESEKGFDRVRASVSTDGGSTFGDAVEVDYNTGKLTLNADTSINTKVKVEALAAGSVSDSQMFDLMISETGPAGLLAMLGASSCIAGVIRKRKK